MISLLKPVPPSTDTGAFMLYSTWLLPAPVRTSVSAAVEKPLVRIGSGRQYGAATVAHPPGSLMLPTPSVWARAKPRTMNRLLPPSPSRCTTAWLLYTVNVLLPVPPWATSGSLVPRDSQPRVVATVATSKTFSAARLPERPYVGRSAGAQATPPAVRRMQSSWPISMLLSAVPQSEQHG